MDELQAHICDTFRFNHIRQMAPMVDENATRWLALVRLHAGRAHTGLCHASGFFVSLPCAILSWPSHLLSARKYTPTVSYRILSEHIIAHRFDNVNDVIWFYYPINFVVTSLCLSSYYVRLSLTVVIDDLLVTTVWKDEFHLMTTNSGGCIGNFSRNNCRW